VRFAPLCTLLFYATFADYVRNIPLQRKKLRPVIEDSDVLEYVRDEYMDYFKMASALHVPPQLLDFKLRSMERRGHGVRPPVGLGSKFLTK